jgi:hypothetical protein
VTREQAIHFREEQGFDQSDLDEFRRSIRNPVWAAAPGLGGGFRYFLIEAVEALTEKEE